MHQFKVSGLNSVHLICDSYISMFEPEVEIRIANYIQTTYLFHNFDPYSSSYFFNVLLCNI